MVYRVLCHLRVDGKSLIMNNDFFFQFLLGSCRFSLLRCSDCVSFTYSVHFIFLRSSGDLFADLQYANGWSASLCIIDLRQGGKKGHREYRHKKELLAEYRKLKVLRRKLEHCAKKKNAYSAIFSDFISISRLP